MGGIDRQQGGAEQRWPEWRVGRTEAAGVSKTSNEHSVLLSE
jgi:hypothetical protein